jgi:hypothetical protein
MIDLQQLKILAQLIDNMEVITSVLEESYNRNNAEDFNKAKKELLDIQDKISKISESRIK